MRASQRNQPSQPQLKSSARSCLDSHSTDRPTKSGRGQTAPVLESSPFPTILRYPLDSFQDSLYPCVLPVCLDCTYGCIYTLGFIWFDILTTQSIICKTGNSRCITPDILNHIMHFNKTPKWLVCTFQFCILYEEPLIILQFHKFAISAFVLTLLSALCLLFLKTQTNPTQLKFPPFPQSFL